MSIKLEHVWKEYKVGKSYIIALKDVSLEIREGEFVCIMGPSGSGKSSLLHIMGCLDRPTKGKVLFYGRDISKLSDKELARIRNKEIGFIFQIYYLFPYLNVLENVLVPMALGGKVDKKRAIDLLNKVGLGDKLYVYPNELSGGEQQRVCIARALANNPKIILADEPTANLDISSARNVMEILKKLWEEGKTVVVVTHDPRVAEYAERIVVIKDGRIVADGVSLEEALNILKK